MHWLFWVASAVLFSVGYHLGYKMVSGKFSTLFNVAMITLIVSIISFGLYFYKDYTKGSLSSFTLGDIWPFLLVGAVMTGLEVSVMMLYRSGGPISLAQAMASGSVSAILLILGVFYFKEHLNMGQMAGLILALSGVTLMSYFSHKA